MYKKQANQGLFNKISWVKGIYLALILDVPTLIQQAAAREAHVNERTGVNGEAGQVIPVERGSADRATASVQ